MIALVDGPSTILNLQGRNLISQYLSHEGLDETILEIILRKFGLKEISEVEMIVLEVNGSYSLVPSRSDNKQIKSLKIPSSPIG